MKEQAPKRILPPNNKLIPPPVQVSVWKVDGKLFESPKAAIEAWKAIVGNSLVSMIEKNLNHLNSLFGEENS